MFPPIRRLAAIVSLLFVVVTGLIHAQPYDTAPVQRLVAPNGCPMPCWEGIQPGVTTSTQVAEMIRNHRWVASWRYYPSMATGDASILWAWNDSYPSYVDPERRGVIWIRRGVVDRIDIPTNIRYGDMWLTHKPPWIQLVATSVGSRDELFAFSTYPDSGLQTRLFIACPLRPAVLWNTPIIVLFAHRADRDLIGGQAVNAATPGICQA